MTKGKRRRLNLDFSRKFLDDKRGLSAVVATLIIILLVMVAIGIVWLVISNVVKGGAEQIELNQRCLSVDFSSIGVLPVSDQDGNYSVTLTRSSSGETITGVKITLFNSVSNSGTLEFGESLKPLDTKIKIIDAGITSANRIDITPYFVDSSGGEELCPQTRSFVLGSSGSVIIPPGGGDGGEQGEPGTGFCGDNIIQIPNGDDVNEICDGTNNNGQTCVSQGYVGGALACSIDCLSFDVSQCTSPAPGSCDGFWEPPEDLGVECDGTPLPNGCSDSCICESGFTQDGSGGCSLNPSINNGTINSVWNSIYFDSQDFPKSQVTMSSYTGFSVNFSDSPETACFRVDFADYVVDTDISYMRLDDSLGFPNINSGEGYSVWEAENCGQ